MDDMDNTDKTVPEILKPKRIELPIEWHVSEHIQSRYATNTVVQAGQNEFILSFFETLPPLLLGNSEQKADLVTRLHSIRAECIGRIIVAPEQILGIIAALQTSWEAYERSRSPEEEE